jgi:hypothetical protein
MKTPAPSHRPRLLLLLVAALSLVLFLVLRQGGPPESSAGSPHGGSGPQPSPPESAASAAPSGKSSDRASRNADRLLAGKDARTDVSLATFPAKDYLRLPSPGGKAAGAPAGEAFIHVPSAGRRVALEANQIGEFPSVETRPGDTVGVRLSLDAVKPGTPVRVVILDGGSFPAAEGVSQLLEAAGWRGVAFEYTTSANIGTHRVLVQAAGQPSRILDFNAVEAEGS